MNSSTENKVTGSAPIQGELWGKRAKDWSQIQEPKATPLFNDILSNVKTTTSITKLLDIGCGAGVLCKLAFDRGMDVSGFDASGPLLEEAKRRLEKDCFYQGDMEHLPFKDETFDVVTAITSIQFAENSANALKEANRVLKKSGQFFMAIWGQPEQCEANIVLSVLKDLMPPPEQPPAPPAALYETGKLERLISENGFIPIQRVDFSYAWEYENADTLLKAFLSAGLVELAIRHSGEDTVKNAMLNAMEPLRKEDGSFSIKNVFTYVVATK